MKKYTIFVVYSLKESNYTERPYFHCAHKLYDTPEDAIRAVSDEIEINYKNDNYHGFKIELPIVKRTKNYTDIYPGVFKCAYSFGPMVRYDIYITEVE